MSCLTAAGRMRIASFKVHVLLCWIFLFLACLLFSDQQATRWWVWLKDVPWLWIWDSIQWDDNLLLHWPTWFFTYSWSLWTDWLKWNPFLHNFQSCKMRSCSLPWCHLEATMILSSIPSVSWITFWRVLPEVKSSRRFAMDGLWMGILKWGLPWLPLFLPRFQMIN